MGTARFLIDNLITSDAMLTVSSERAGAVGLAVKVGQGSASLQAAGPYTGANPGQYVVEIDSVVSGTGIGQATFRWRPTSTSTWTAQGVATSTSPVVLENGLTVAWTTGGGIDLASGDYWTITADKPYGKARLMDRDRDTEWRSDGVGVAVTVDVDLGSAQAVDVVALCDHNLSAAAVIAIAGNSTASWGSPPLSETITRQATNVLRYLTTGSRTYRYWRLTLTDTANPDGYLRLGELFLGTYTEFSGNFDRQWGRARNAALFGPTGDLRKPRGIWAVAEVLDLQYRLMTPDDRDKAVTLYDYLYSPTVGTVRPILVNLDSATPADVSLYELEAPSLPVASPYLDRFEWSLRLSQRPRLARSGS